MKKTLRKKINEKGSNLKRPIRKKKLMMQTESQGNEKEMHEAGTIKRKSLYMQQE